MTGKLAAAGIAAGLLAFGGLRDAHACEPVFEPSTLEYPAMTPSDVTFTSDAYAVACDDKTCIVTATLGVDVPSVTHVVLAGRRTHDAMFSVDGAAPVADLTMQPGAKQLVVTAKIDLSLNVDACSQTGISARHPLLGASLKQAPQFALQFAARSVPQVTAPADWDVATNQGYDRDRAVATTWLTPPPPAYYPGGPFALVGFASGAGEAFRARAGWEVGAVRPWLGFAGSFDTDFGSYFALAATADATSHTGMLPLSYNGGIGPVGVLSPSAHFGGRAHFSVAFGPARMDVSLDVLTSGDASVGIWLGGSL